jgi:hypothetical protein
MTATLSAHQGTSLVSREEVMALVTPDARSSTHRVVPHSEVIVEITGELARRNLTLAKEAYSLSPDGNRLFGVLDTRDDLMPNGIGIAIGIRNSHDRTLALGVCAGTRVFVCDNLAFSGEVVRYRKHTSRISAPEVIRGAIDQILESTHREARWLEQLKNRQLTNVRAKVILMDLLRAGACTSHQLQEVVRLYFDTPPDLERLVAPGSGWDLFNCVTRTYRDQAPGLTLRRSRQLNHVFGQLISRN